MAYVIHVHSQKYFKKPTPSESLLLPGTFSCPAFLSLPPTKRQAACQLKKNTQKEKIKVGRLYKLNTQTLQKLRSVLGPGSFLSCHACLYQGQQGRVKLQRMSGRCDGNFSHFMRILYPSWYHKESPVHVLSVLEAPTHWIPCAFGGRSETLCTLSLTCYASFPPLID